MFLFKMFLNIKRIQQLYGFGNDALRKLTLTTHYAEY